MGYHMDLNKITLDEFKERLNSQYLLPSQKILENNLEDNFETIKSYGIVTMYDLQDALKSKVKVNKFSNESGISVEYLSVVRREINSYLPKFRNLDEFVDVKKNSLMVLKSHRIKNTYQLFEHIKTKEDRKKLSEDMSIPYDEVILLTMYTDLSRIKWVGPVFAKLLIKSEYDSVLKVSKANFNDLYNNVKHMNKDNQYYRGQFGINDAKLLVTVAKDVPIDIEY